MSEGWEDEYMSKLENEIKDLRTEIEELKNEVDFQKTVRENQAMMIKKKLEENEKLRELVKGFVELDGITFPARKKELMDKAKELLG